PEQELATLRGACEDKLQGTHKPSPALGKKFRELLLPCRHIRHGEIVLAENPPNPPARKQVTRVVSRAHRLLQGTKEDRLVFASTTDLPSCPEGDEDRKSTRLTPVTSLSRMPSSA